MLKKSSKKLRNDALNSALRLLCRREHSAVELCEKLQQKGYTANEAKTALTACQRLDLQSDKRFVACYIRTRIRQGYGPIKINQELINKGLDKELVYNILDKESENWLTYAVEAWQKKSKGRHELSFEELQKQQRFLLYRGFTRDIIAKVKKELESAQ